MNRRKEFIFKVVFPAAVFLAIAAGVYEMRTRPRGPRVIGNMYVLQLVAEDFSDRSRGSYPAHINTTVKEVLEDLGKSSDDQSSIAGAKGMDRVRMTDIGSTGPAILPRGYRNPYAESGVAVDMSDLDPPTWSPDSKGIVFYVPLEVRGKVAGQYKVYGAGRNGLLDSVLTSER
ncbi:hypothetical protein E3J62_11820 [candidate division TA06 bacterium]|uniref:Uncharacterized protein n=1 Tax=candidate division TA06 bacterium TaxID=2250710 RepID=A0A523UMZ3_UNCT6|nr:MAG: hypothetical protein E3J62_11820 [candidate division TA06 bacterium]